MWMANTGTARRKLIWFYHCFEIQQPLDSRNVFLAVTVMILPIALAVSDTLSVPDEIPATLEKISLTDAAERRKDSLPEKEKFLEAEEKSADRFVLDDNGKGASVIRKPVHENTSLSKGLQLAVAFSANIGGVATLIGSHPNILFRMTLEKYVQLY